MQLLKDTYIHGSATISNRIESNGVIGPDNLRIFQLSYVKSYMQAGIRGVGEVQLQCRVRANGEIDATGFELFSGTIGECTGSVIFTISGHINPENNLESGKVSIDRGAGSAELYSLSCTGSYVTKAEVCSFELTQGP